MDALSYSRCIEILAELDKKFYKKEDKAMLLELGYIIKQNNGRGGGSNNVTELMNDNKKLHQENQAMISNTLKMKEILNVKIGEIAKIFDAISEKYNYINKQIQELKKSVG